MPSYISYTSIIYYDGVITRSLASLLTSNYYPLLPEVASNNDYISMVFNIFTPMSRTLCFERITSLLPASSVLS